MPPAITAFWGKLNGNEKLAMYGVIVAIIAYLISLVGSFGSSSTGGAVLLGAIIVTVLYWLKYSTNKIPWPIPFPTIVVAVAGVSLVLALLNLLPALQFIGSSYGIAAIATVVGAGIMTYGAWKEYQTIAPKNPAPPAA